MNKIVKTAGNLPGLRGVYARAEEIIALWSKTVGRSLADDLATFDAVLPQAQAMLACLQSDLGPAPRPEIAKHITVLAGCFSNGPASAEIYARTMMEYVAAAQSSLDEVEFVCRRMIETRTSPFQPTIAEVLNALAAAEEHREGMIRRLTSITSMDRNKLVQAAEQERQIRLRRERRMK